MAYIDTSVLAAYYCPERISVKAQRALAGIEVPTISPLVEVELHSAVVGKVRNRELDPASGARIVSLLRAHVSDGYFRVVPVGAEEYRLACEWIVSFSSPLRALDGLHLAAAFANDLPILTADKGLARSARALNVAFELVS
ncbi:MAG: type II toxin-antitoxin system VapC family toxin [Phycisphaerae bacterium]|nr:type II toxin-antitoxin system VapC family toxin [Phycisphaerae bacterium]